VVVGSERGLCGRFNEAVVELALEEWAARPVERRELLALGSRAVRLLSQRGRRPAWSAPLSVTALPSPSLAFDLARRWLARYEAHELDTVDVIYNHYRGPALFTPSVSMSRSSASGLLCASTASCWSRLLPSSPCAASCWTAQPETRND